MSAFNVIRGVTFRDYDTAGMDGCEAAVEEGVITLRNVPDELTAWQARSWAALLMEAAIELEWSEAGRKALGEGE